MTVFIVFICRKYDQSQDFEKDNENPFNSQKENGKRGDTSSYKYVDRINNSAEGLKIAADDLIELKKTRILDKKLLAILKEIFIFIVFLVVLYAVSFSNLSNSSLQYNVLFQNTFVQSQSQYEIGLNYVI